MNSGALDQIVGAFVTALQSGFLALQGYALPLLAGLALLTYTVNGLRMLAGSEQLGDALASTLFTVLKIGIFYWLISNLYPFTMALFQTFLSWGLAVSHGAFSAETFLHPSSILDAGFRAAYPIQKLIQAFTGWAALFNMHVIFGYMLVYWGIVGAFAFVVFHLIMAIIEFHLAVMISPVLIPWGVFSHTAFFAEFSMSWITAGLIRIMLTGAIMGIAIPLFEVLTVALTAGGDPTLYSAMVMLFACLIFAGLAWKVPERAAWVGGRGMALALEGSTLLAGARTPLGVVARMQMVGTVAARGVSAMLTGRR